MPDRYLWSTWRPLAAGVVALVLAAGPAWGQQRSSSASAKDQSKDAEPVVRTFGSEGSFRTEVTSRTKGNKLTEEDRRQASLLMAQAFQHIDKARDAIDADDSREALKEVNKSREAIKAIRSMLPEAVIHTKTTAPDGKVIYEDEYAVQESRIPLFEGMLHSQTLAPILAARRYALDIAGVRVVESESIVTEAIADLDRIDAQLARAAKALDEKKVDDAAKALALALVRGIDVRVSKEDTELASARDAIWLARRSLEENNAAQALINLEVARLRLRVYREVLSQDERKEVDQMLAEIEQLEGQLRHDKTQPASRAERARQGHLLTSWWDKVNSWFKRHL